MMNGWNGTVGGMNSTSALLMLVTVVAVVLLALWVVRALFPAEHASERATALALLTHRYDAGEITAAEYEQARHALGS